MRNRQRFAAYTGRRILVTGHTGFTGSWALLWLNSLKADVVGLSLAPHTKPSLYEEAGLDALCGSNLADIRDSAAVRELVADVKPDLIWHLAAQPLVIDGYRDPAGTFATNVMGSIAVLEAARSTPGVKGVVYITTDKVYENKHWVRGYRESDPLGANDPYSASKACADLVAQCYVKSFPDLPVAVARGGNIIGGGDWADGRLIPDFVRAIRYDETLMLRYPNATRPWQHVLSLVEGYLILGAELLGGNRDVARAWNFGPIDARSYSVRDIVDLMGRAWREPPVGLKAAEVSEERALTLNSSLARSALAWEPIWDTEQTVIKTADWYRRSYESPGAARTLMLEQIGEWA